MDALVAHTEYLESLINLVPREQYREQAPEALSRFAKHTSAKAMAAAGKRRPAAGGKKGGKAAGGTGDGGANGAGGSDDEDGEHDGDEDEDGDARMTEAGPSPRRSIDELKVLVNKMVKSRKRRSPEEEDDDNDDVDLAGGRGGNGDEEGDHWDDSGPAVAAAAAAAAAAAEGGDHKVDKRRRQSGEMSLMYSKFDLSSTPAMKRPKKGKSKVALLKEAEAQRKRMEELKKTDEGQLLANDLAFKTAEARMKGVKVKDDPKLLRKALKQEHVKKVKSAKQWQERRAAQEKAMAERQKNRLDHIRDRKHGKLAKKLGVKRTTTKVVRRKPSKRAGFEGRK